MKKIILSMSGVIASLMISVFGSFNTAVFAGNCDSYLLGFPAWYNGLECDNGNIKSSNFKGDEMPKSIWKIILNVMTDLSIAVGILATAFVIYGGYLFIFSGGSPDKVAKGKDTIKNAVIGIVIAVGSGAIMVTIRTILSAQ